MIQIIGWTIFHSLWQIALIASLYLLIKNTWPSSTALKKYYLAVGALATAVLTTGSTFGYLWKQNFSFDSPQIDSTLTTITSSIPTTIIPVEPNEIVVETALTWMDYVSLCLPYLVVFWGMGLIYFTIRFLLNLYGVKKLQEGEKELIPSPWLTKIAAFKTQLNIQKNVQIFLSKHVKEPITFGHFKPFILLPVSLITSFDTKAVEMILLHELAHIKRHDYLVNLGQSIIEIILFYHPLVWWLSKDIRELREHCCDDLVLSLGDNRATYVETLTALQWRKIGGVSNRLSLSASGNNSGFSKRIKRMFGVEEERGSFRWLMGIFIILLIFAAGGVWLKNELSNQTKVTPDFTFVLDENTTVKDLDELTEKMRALGIIKSLCWLKDDDRLTSINGEYYDADKNIQFFDIIDFQQTPKQFIFDNGYLKEISDLSSNSSLGNLFIIDATTRRSDLDKWSDKLANNDIKFDFSQSVFTETGQLVEFKVAYNDNYSRRSFSADDMSCFRFYFELYGDILMSPEFLKQGEVPKAYNPVPLGFNHLRDTTKASFIVYGGMSSKEFSQEWGDFHRKTGSKITFNNITFYKDSIVVRDIRGTINPQKYGAETYYFDIHDLEKYSVQFTGNANGIFRPQYIDNDSKQVISAKKDNGGLISSFLVDKYTTKKELSKWAKSILKHGVVFNYEKSIFDKNDRLVGLNGKFYGKCCYFDEFYYNVSDQQIKLEVKDDYIYQPMVIKVKDGIKTEYEINLSKAENAYEREIWENKLADLEEQRSKMKKAFRFPNSSINFIKPNFSEENKPKQLSYKITNGESIGLDSSLYVIKGNFENHKRNNIAKLIPPFMVDDSVRALNPIYRQGFTGDAKPIYVNGQLIAKEDLPIFMQNQLQEAIKTDVPKTERYPKATDMTVDWLYWGDQKINLGAAFKKNKAGEWEWNPPKLEISKVVWDRNKDRPFIFQIDGIWRRIKDLETVLLIPKKQDPTSINFNLGYAQAISYKEGSVFKLLARAKAKDQLFFEKIDIGLPILISMAVKIVEDQSTGFVPKKEELIEQPKDKIATGIEVIGRKDIVVSPERNKRLPTVGINSPYRVHWDNLAFEVKTTVKERINEAKTIQVSTLEITQKQWKRLYNQPFTFDLNNNWYKVKTIKEIVLVPFKKDPVSAALHQDYYQVIKDKNHRAIKLLAEAKVGDGIYFERIDVGKDFTFEMVVKIVEDKPTNSTGFIPKQDIQFDEKDDLMSMDGYPPASENTSFPVMKIDAFLPKNSPSTNLGWSRIPPKKAPVYLINGVKYDTGWPEKLSHEAIKSMNVLWGLKAKSLYGVDEIYIIETNEPFWIGDSTHTLKTVDEVLKPVTNKSKN